MATRKNRRLEKLSQYARVIIGPVGAITGPDFDPVGLEKHRVTINRIIIGMCPESSFPPKLRSKSVLVSGFRIIVCGPFQPNLMTGIGSISFSDNSNTLTIGVSLCNELIELVDEERLRKLLAGCFRKMSQELAAYLRPYMGDLANEIVSGWKTILAAYLAMPLPLPMLSASGNEPTTSTERPLTYYLYFGRKIDADGAKKELVAHGLSCVVTKSDARWLCEATTLSLAAVDADEVNFLERVAIRYYGEFDGLDLGP